MPSLSGVPGVFVDTSAWFSYVNASDPHHARVVAFIEAFQGRFFTSEYVFDETVTLCRRRLGHAVAIKIGAVLLDPVAVECIRISPALFSAAWRLFSHRSDKPYSFTDCSSFIVMHERKLTTALALDDNFRQEGFHTVP